MAWIRTRRRSDGSSAIAVIYELPDGTQTSATFDEPEAAEEFKTAVNTIGAEKAMRGWGITPTKRAATRSTAPTVASWLQTYIDTRTGVTKSTLFDYRSYLKHDIEPTIGKIPVDLLTPADIAAWVNAMAEKGVAGKTIGNKHGFLSAALATAVTAQHIAINPAIGTRIPRTERKEMCFLTHDEFDLLLGCVEERWRPTVRFMVASGCRLGELTALRPGDVDKSQHRVRIGRSRKRTYEAGGYEIGATKTKKSNRTIVVHPDVLDELDYTGAWLFANPDGTPITAVVWRKNVWYPAVRKAQALGLEKQPRIHDLRHTCASWMIAGGADMYAVQRHLGHESIQTTINSYTHLDARQAQAAADIIGKALRRDQPSE